MAHSQNSDPVNIERILEAAVVASWTDLMRSGQSGLIHIEYTCTAAGNMDYLQVWSSITRGYWLRVCTYSMSASPSHETGGRFDNGYKSDGLAHILEIVMQHQSSFRLPRQFGGHGLLQIATPTPEEIKAAAEVTETFNRLDSAPAEPALVSPASGNSGCVDESAKQQSILAAKSLT